MSQYRLPPGTLSAQLRFPSRLGYEKIAMQTTSAIAELLGFDPQRIEAMKTVVSEACINAIEHGNQSDASKLISLEFDGLPDTLEIRVRDQGKGVVPEMVEDPDIDRKMAGLERSRGMGLFLIRNLSDEVEWSNHPEGGSCARILFKVPTAAGVAALEKKEENQL
jgi:serine/threonine-protein kinase RsbW